ncbi:MAG: PAS domain-containing protein [Myxococcota bacterium]|nr:PAS domain-containing protein [Myxococcota bacterium]
MNPSLEWASWIVTRRVAIDRALQDRLGAERPGPAAPESEALRRFRSFAAAALRRGPGAEPALDGLRVDSQRTLALLDGWCHAAAELAGPRGGEVRALLDPLAARFRAALTGSQIARPARHARRPARRAVAAAIDRVADAFLAVDLETGAIVDANPAAAALLGTEREKLVGARARRYVHADAGDIWEQRLAALVESPEAQRFRAILLDALARPIAVEVSATPHATRARSLALVLARPV